MNTIRKWFGEKTHAVMCVVFLLVFLLNLLATPVSDDYVYTIHNGIFDILRREYVQYMTWTGRTTAHLIARTFLAMPKLLFDIANSFCFCLLLWLINVHASGEKKVGAFAYAMSAALAFLFVPLFGQTVLWETGSCNYLWTTTIIFAFLLPYRLELEQKQNHGKWFPLLYILAAIPAGWTNENTGGALVMMILCFFLLYKWKKVAWKSWMFTGLCGSVFGFAMMVLAPGNKIRSADFVSTAGKAYDLIHDLVNTNVVFKEGMLFLWLLFGAGIACLLICKEKEKAFLSAAYAACGAAAVMAIILSPVPVYYDRSMFGASIFVITAIMVAVVHQKVLEKTLQIGLGVLVVFTVLDYCYALVDLTYSRYQFKEREDYVAQQKAQGNLNPTIPIYNSEFVGKYNPNYGLVYLTENRNFDNNRFFSQIHGIASIASTSIERWNAVYKNGDPRLMNIQTLNAYVDALKDNGNYVVLVTCSSLSEDEEELREQVNHLSDSLQLDASHFIVYANGGYAEEISSEDAIDGEFWINGHYCYISSQQSGPVSDIIVDNVEYTTNNDGVTFVVFDLEKDRVVDAVTFTKNGSTRSYKQN